MNLVSVMLEKYEKLSAATEYAIGFIYNHELYMIEMSELSENYIRTEKSSAKNGGTYALRLRLNKNEKENLIATGAKKIGSETIIADKKYNKGEMFEKIVTEKYNQTWTKDNIPFYKAGDISLKDEHIEIQVKLDGATICTEQSLINAEKMVKIAA